MKTNLGGSWVVQLVKHLTLDSGSGHAWSPRLLRLSPESGSTLAAQSLLGIFSLSLFLSPSPSLPPATPPIHCLHMLSLNINKHLKKI